ncbi:MAG: hypothetical protein ACI9EF_001757 [Pseudohongiellaceae bacterium]|jgi:hypothetical protein
MVAIMGTSTWWKSLWLLAVCLAACAPLEPTNRYGLDGLNEHLTPESETGRWALSPVAVPVGLATYFVDGLLIHPFYVWDDAWTDTRDAVWDTRDESRFRRALVYPLRVVGTPVVYLLSFAGRWLGPSENKPVDEQPWDRPPGGEQ